MASISFDPFLTLKQIHALPDLPRALHTLTFPELLLEGADREYEAVDLTADHALFSRINLLIGALVEYRDLSPLLGQIEVYYREHIEEVCATGGRAIFQSEGLIDNRGRTPLHHAARSGQVEEVKLLLKLGALVNAADFDGYTPLHIAVRHGHRAVVERLIAGGGDPTLVTSEGETLLHLAVDFGDEGLVWLVLNEIALFEQPLFRSPQRVDDGSLPIDRASAQKWLHQTEASGAIPLDRAVCGASKPEVVRLLIEAGTRTTTTRALDWSIKNGHFESGLLLLEESPFLPISFSPSIRRGEKLAMESLEEAIERGDLCGQIFYLARLTEPLLERRDYRRAALLFNGAYRIAQNSSIFEPCKQLVLSQLQQIEKWFVLAETGREPSEIRILNWRAKLVEARQEIASSFGSRQPLDLALKELSQSYKELLCDLLEEAIRLKGQEPPTRFAMVGLGSMSRDEICPYSDVEFLFLIENDCEENRAYFRSISRIMDFFIINLGETSFKIIRGEESLTSSGFSLDIGGISPFGDWDGAERTYELIGSPQVLASFQYRDNIILVNAMATSCLITGETRLLDLYQSEVNLILNATSPDGGSVRQQRALELMRGDLQEFQPQLNLRKIKLGTFDAKKELYRLLQSTLSNLALYYGLSVKNGFQRIDQLVAREVMSQTGGAHFKRALRLALELRVKTHLFYQKECERLYQREELPTPHSYLITPECRFKIVQIYRTLIPLCEAVQGFSDGDRSAFKRNPLYDKTIGCYVDEERQQLLLQRSLRSSTIAAALNPDNSSTQWDLGINQGECGQFQRAFQSLEKAYHLLANRHSDYLHPDLIGALGNLGVACQNIDLLFQSIEWLNSSLSLCQQIYGKEPHTDLGDTLFNLGNSYRHLNQLDRAVELYEEALSVYQGLYLGAPHYRIAATFMGLGIAFEKLEKFDRALHYYQESISIKERLYTDKRHPSLARSYSNLGALYITLGNYSDALGQLETALSIQQSIYQETPHPELAHTQSLLGALYDKQGYPDLSLQFYQQSLSTQKKVSKKLDLDGLEQLGIVHLELEEYQEAIAIFKEIAARQQQIYNNSSHPAIANTWNYLGTIHTKLDEYDQAIDCYSQALSMVENSRFPLLTSKILANLGNSWRLSGKFDIAIEKLEAALLIQRELFPDQSYSEIAVVLNILATAQMSLGEYRKAIASFKEIEVIYKKIFHDHHPLVAGLLYNLGNNYVRLSELGLAIEHYRRALAIQRVVYGERPVVALANTLNDLASALTDIADYRSALALYEETLSLKRGLGQRCPPSSLSATLSSLGNLYDDLHDFDKAIASHQEALAISRSVHREDHPAIATIFNNLGVAYLNQGDGKNAIDCFEKALSIQQANFREHLSIAASLMNLGNVYHRQKEFNRAIDYYQNALKMQRAIYKDDETIEISGTLTNLGIAYTYCNPSRLKEAIETLNSSLRIQQRIYGLTPHPNLASTWINLGNSYASSNMRDQAIKAYRTGYSIFSESLGASHPSTAKALQVLNLALG